VSRRLVTIGEADRHDNSPVKTTLNPSRACLVVRYTLRRRPIQRDRGLLRASPAWSGPARPLARRLPPHATRLASAEPAHLGSRVVFAAAPPASPRDHGVRTRKSRPSRRFRTAFTRTRGSGRRKRSRVSRRPALAICGPMVHMGNRKVGEGRTARQSGQVRKEAALTRQGGSLSNLPPSLLGRRWRAAADSVHPIEP